MQGQFTSGANTIAQRAAIAALKSDLIETVRMRDIFLKRRDMVLERLSRIDGLKLNKPKGAFYVFPDVSSFFGLKANGKTIENPTDISEYLLYEAGVAVVTGTAFGDSNCIRISYAASEDDLIKSTDRIASALNNLKT